MKSIASNTIRALQYLRFSAWERRVVCIARRFDFLTNHAHVLLCVAREPGMRLRDIASCVGITERAAHRIVCELESEGYLSRTREGRRNVYEVHDGLPLGHDLDGQATAGDLIAALSR